MRRQGAPVGAVAILRRASWARPAWAGGLAPDIERLALVFVWRAPFLPEQRRAATSWLPGFRNCCAWALSHCPWNLQNQGPPMRRHRVTAPPALRSGGRAPSRIPMHSSFKDRTPLLEGGPGRGLPVV